MTISDVAQVLTAIAAVGAMLISWRNSKKIEQVHKTTNSLAQRNESIAKELGIREGKEFERANPS